MVRSCLRCPLPAARCPLPACYTPVALPLAGRRYNGRAPAGSRPGATPHVSSGGVPMKALLVLTAAATLAAWVTAVAADPPPAAPPAAGPAIKSVSGPFTSGNLTVFLLHGP